jgi:hypothetical protein
VTFAEQLKAVCSRTTVCATVEKNVKHFRFSPEEWYEVLKWTLRTEGRDKVISCHRECTRTRDVKRVL